MPANESLKLIPAAPFGNGGNGAGTRASGAISEGVPAEGGEGGCHEPGYRRLPTLNRDIDLAKRALGSERWPITPTRRAEIVEWLMLIVDSCDDPRTQVNAARAILAADKLNLEESKILVQLDRADREAEAAELARQQAMQPLIAANATEVNVNVKHSGEITVGHTVISRIAALESAFAGAAARTGEGLVSGDGPREPVDSGGDQGGHDGEAG